ncbi:MAG: FAD-dependent oxidoreductase [Chloroflexi bacterium]|nr:FAD-dependent oxidoreductase [Chloroflexota bacterium]
MSDILIIGGGVIGVTAAYFLARKGVSVTLIEKAEIAAGSSYGNAGLVCPCHSVPLPAPGVLTQGIKWLFDPESPFYIKPRLDMDLLVWLRHFQSFSNRKAFDRAVPLLRDLQRASLDLYQTIIEQENLTCHFEKSGGFMLYRTSTGFEHGQKETAALQTHGLQMKLLTGDEVRQREPLTHQAVVGGIYYKEDAHLTPDLFVKGLAKAAQTEGVNLLTQTELLGFETDGNRITVVNSTRGTFQPKQVVLTAGVWSSLLVRQLGLKLPMQPAKGYSVTIKRPSPSPQTYLYLGESKVVVTPMGPHLRFAGTLELAGYDLSINQRRVNALLRAVDDYVIGLEEKEIVEIWRGLRPCSPDGLPYIGRSAAFNNLLVAAGHGTLGLSMGPITGQLIAELALGERSSLNMAAFAMERFG